MFQEDTFAECPSKDVFNIPVGRELVNHPLLFIELLFNKGTVPFGENSSTSNYFVDGKHSMEHFNTTELHRISKLGKPYMHKETTVNSIHAGISKTRSGRGRGAESVPFLTPLPFIQIEPNFV